MKKIFLFMLAATAILSSCGSDDGDGGAKTPSSVILTAEGTALNYAFTYDNKNRMTQMVKTGAVPASVTFTYGENGKASNMSVTSGGTTTNMIMAYDAQDRLSSIAEQGQEPVAINWNGDNSFTFSGTPVTLSDKGDIQSFNSGGSSISRTFSNSKKGIFASVKSFDPLFLLITDLQTVLFASKMPIATLTSAGSTFMYNNTFAGAYPTATTITTPDGNVSINVTYN